MTHPYLPPVAGRILLGTISDSSNEATMGALTKRQADYLAFIKSKLGDDVTVRNVSYQDTSIREEGLSGGAGFSLYFELLARHENRKHSATYKRKYSAANKPPTIRTWISTFLPPLLKFQSAHYRKRLRQLKAVETVVSDKHIFLWTSIVEAGATGGIIFESDFEPGPRKGWDSLPSEIARHSQDYDYIDFSASFSLEKLGLPPAEDYLSLEILTTNTLCAYWISRRAAAAALAAVSRRPWLRAIGSDFLLNSINHRDARWRSLLFSVPVIGHASMKNRAKSTIGTI